MITEHKENVRDALQFLKDAVPAKYLPIVTEAGALLDLRFPHYGAEMRGIASASGLELGDVVLLNLLYDLTVHCTSIVAMNGAGRVYHGRNLDYNLPAVLRPLVVMVHFYNSTDGTKVFSATTFAGSVGVLTGVSPQGVSMSVDERDADTGFVFENLLELLLVKDSRPVTFLVRDILEAGGAYETSFLKATLTPVLAPVYLILAGTTGQGAIITRNRLDTQNVWSLGPDNWFVLVSNYDPWLPDPKRDPRRTVAENELKRLGQAQGSTPQGLLSALTLHPVLREITIYTSILDPSTGRMTSYLRNVSRSSEF